MNEDLTIAEDLVVPAGELRWRFDTSGGPGGQHANRSASRVELSFDLGGSPSVRADLRERLVDRLGHRVRDGVLSVSVDESRSQWRNRQLARRRLAAVIRDALAETPSRIPTRPSKASRLRRLADKRHRSETKRLRRSPEPD